MVEQSSLGGKISLKEGDCFARATSVAKAKCFARVFDEGAIARMPLAMVLSN